MIYFDDVSKKFEFKDKVYYSIKNLNLNIESGEFVVFMGHSGAGKTTLMKLITREYLPSSGHIYFNSVDISTFNRSQMNKYRRNIGMIYQDYKLISDMTVYENVAFAMEVSGRTNQEIKDDVPHVLELVGLAGKKDYFPTQLSGGEKQRVAIARAIVNNPDVILADEVTGNLDPENTRDIIKILKKINSFGTTIILTTHDKSVANLINERLIVLEAGKIVKDSGNKNNNL